MDLILSLTTLVLIAAGLAMQIMTRRAWQSAIAAVESRIDRLESRASVVERITEASATLSSAMNHSVAARVANTETALAELKRREEARRAAPSATDLAKTIGLLDFKTPNEMRGDEIDWNQPTRIVTELPANPSSRRPRPTKPEGK